MRVLEVEDYTLEPPCSVKVGRGGRSTDSLWPASYDWEHTSPMHPQMNV